MGKFLILKFIYLLINMLGNFNDFYGLFVNLFENILSVLVFCFVVHKTFEELVDHLENLRVRANILPDCFDLVLQVLQVFEHGNVRLI